MVAHVPDLRYGWMVVLLSVLCAYHIYTPLGTTGYIRCAPMLGTKRRRKENSFSASTLLLIEPN